MSALTNSARSPELISLVERPIIVLGTPRSGSSTLFAALAAHPKLWSLHRESRAIYEGPFHPARNGWRSNVLTEEDLDDALRVQLTRTVFEGVGNLDLFPFRRLIPIKGRGRYTERIAKLTRPFKRPPIRIVEKTVANVLRIPFLQKLFPDALFLYLIRNPRSNIASLYRGWQDPKKHNDYPLPANFEIKDLRGSHSSFLLPPDWRTWNGRSLVEVCAQQWAACHEFCLRDLERIEANRVHRLRYEDLIDDPFTSLRVVAEWAGLSDRYFRRFKRGLPRINVGGGGGAAMWPGLDEEVEKVLPSVASVATKLGYD